MIVGALFGAGGGGGEGRAFDRYSLVFTITNPLFSFNYYCMLVLSMLMNEAKVECVRVYIVVSSSS